MSEESLLNRRVKMICDELFKDITKDESKINELMYPKSYISGLSEDQLFQAKLDESIAEVVSTGVIENYMSLIRLLIVKVAKAYIEEDRMM